MEIGNKYCEDILIDQSSLVDLGRKGDHFTSLDGLHSDTDNNVLEWPLVSSGIPFVYKSLEIL